MNMQSVSVLWPHLLLAFVNLERIYTWRCFASRMENKNPKKITTELSRHVSCLVSQEPHFSIQRNLRNLWFLSWKALLEFRAQWYAEKLATSRCLVNVWILQFSSGSIRWNIKSIKWVVVSNMFYVHLENWGNDPIWLSDGLKPPTSFFFQWVVKKKVQQTKWTLWRLWWFVGTRISYSEIEVAFCTPSTGSRVGEWNSVPSKSTYFQEVGMAWRRWNWIVEEAWSRRWFQICSIFIPIWVNDPIWLIFFKWVETTN